MLVGKSVDMGLPLGQEKLLGWPFLDELLGLIQAPS